MSSVCNRSRLDEPPSTEAVNNRGMKQSPDGLSSSQRTQLDAVGSQIHFATRRAMGPERVNIKDSAQKARFASIDSSPQVDDPTPRRFLEVEP